MTKASKPKNHNAAFAGASLFISGATLLCCALPALLITLGLGSVVAGLVTALPGLVWFSENKIPVFLISGILIICGGIARSFSRSLACPADPAQARACGRIRTISGIMYWSSVGLYITGFFFAFLIKYLI